MRMLVNHRTTVDELTNSSPFSQLLAFTQYYFLIFILTYFFRLFCMLQICSSRCYYDSSSIFTRHFYQECYLLYRIMDRVVTESVSIYRRNTLCNVSNERHPIRHNQIWNKNNFQDARGKRDSATS